ncbi:MetQ/NlpA family ABC transporter substrate-binding protein [Cellulosilyticum sp. ST5]|uniref:MetQ/NlpA family ABC transporter substrate-binding protein n=1 Tax=unclassified Cellulosilyticum TaxID=2643091 RepID=UPI000F8E2FB2|nr:MetQ/NlpA family ABC transporter substrate-binding protein [Cellulosilyticum sp. WCF-2]QEH68784.1 ABC transporter substrate-binding protein [Cellulosilyticum sp. WCF-2]
MKKLLTLSLVAVLSLSLLAGCGKSEASNKIVVGASTSPHAEILAVAKPILKEKGYDLEIKEFSDYVQPNLTLENKELDANYFQHKPYLDDFNSKNGTHLVSVAAVHYEPFGIYPGKSSSIDDIKDGAKIAVPNDTTNEARALMLLQDLGIITVDESAGLAATKTDITSNPRNIEIVEIEAAQLVRTLQDVDFAVINGNYAIQGGLNVEEDALAKEAADSLMAQTYANILAVREGDENREDIKALIEALGSKEVKDFIAEKYQGSVVSLN